MYMFYVLLKGHGQGCDYTIGCNRNFKKLKANNLEEANKEVADLICNYYGGDIKSAVILSVVNEVEVDVDSLIAQQEIDDAEDELERKREQLERLKGNNV